MSEVARRVVVMVESDKIGRKIPNLELAWDKVDVLVTDNGISSEQQVQIQKHNVQVLIA